MEGEELTMLRNKMVLLFDDNTLSLYVIDHARRLGEPGSSATAA
jgi:hypothetical protein